MTISAGSITPLSESPGRAAGARDELGLESFDAESNRSQSALVTISERTPVSLATLKRDRIHCSAAEAVSIGQALCLALVTAQRRQPMNPGHEVSLVPPVTTETVFIDPTSRLGVSVNHPGDDPTAIQSVGRILSDIVPSGARSSLEKKIISKALASPPGFGTLGEVSGALAAFEQPDGRELIQAVYRPVAERQCDYAGAIRCLEHHSKSLLLRIENHVAPPVGVATQMDSSHWLRRRNPDWGGHRWRVADESIVHRGQHHRG